MKDILNYWREIMLQEKTGHINNEPVFLLQRHGRIKVLVSLIFHTWRVKRWASLNGRNEKLTERGHTQLKIKSYTQKQESQTLSKCGWGLYWHFSIQRRFPPGVFEAVGEGFVTTSDSEELYVLRYRKSATASLLLCSHTLLPCLHFSLPHCSFYETYLMNSWSSLPPTRFHVKYEITRSAVPCT